MVCDSGLGNLSISLHTTCPSLSLACQSHMTTVATKTSSFSSDLFSSCFLFPTEPSLAGWLLHLAHQSHSKTGFISHICLTCGSCYSNLSCLHLRAYHISHSAASTQHLASHALPSSPWSLFQNLPFMAVLFLMGIICCLSFKQSGIFFSVVLEAFVSTRQFISFPFSPCSQRSRSLYLSWQAC